MTASLGTLDPGASATITLVVTAASDSDPSNNTYTDASGEHACGGRSAFAIAHLCK